MRFLKVFLICGFFTVVNVLIRTEQDMDICFEKFDKQWYYWVVVRPAILTIMVLALYHTLVKD